MGDEEDTATENIPNTPKNIKKEIKKKEIIWMVMAFALYEAIVIACYLVGCHTKEVVGYSLLASVGVIILFGSYIFFGYLFIYLSLVTSSSIIYHHLSSSIITYHHLSSSSSSSPSC